VTQDSNQFHAICLDTYPPIFYLNEFSKQIIHIVDRILNPELQFKVGYSFDAGPHAFLFMHESVELLVLRYFNELFKLPITSYNAKAKKLIAEAKELEGCAPGRFKKFEGEVIEPHEIWSTSIGGGASQLK
jgi:diphosphomevalonate decarboxylase